VNVSLGSVAVARARAGAKGRFSARFVVPSVAPGHAQITARSRQVTLRIPFTVIDGSAIGPPAPPPIASPVVPPVPEPVVPPVPDPVVAAAGDIACGPHDPGFNGGNGTATGCHARQTSDVVLGIAPAAVLALGDLQYGGGTPENYQLSYGPTWGRFKDITWPVLGNHDNDRGRGSGYFAFFGPRVGSAQRAFYSFDVGAWHLIALDTNLENCAVLSGVNCADAALQEDWLRGDLAAHANRCVLAFFHYPRFSSGGIGSYTTVKPLWDALYAAGADVVLNGHDHNYERFAPQDPAGAADPKGIREFVVGTGGKDLLAMKAPQPNSEVRNNNTFGVLKLTLHPTAYDWEFVPEAGRTFSDAGSAECH
jgi:hypothetical protein